QVSGGGVRGLALGDRPPAVAALCSIQVQIAELAVEAAVEGSRQAALHALLIDPVINDIDVAGKILDDYLTVHADYLPQFAR
ncbi:MAG TPA: alpha-glucosidase/alpha-galactosidase, partial [Armatimonadota bacterium]|nr:alpha-glucosidase/alpha-galactosidase [Armatimonadota bacterium]